MSTPFTYNPWTGAHLAYPQDPVSAREMTLAIVPWLYNPWTGIRRPQSEIQADPQGLKLAPPTPTRAPENPLPFSPISGDRVPGGLADPGYLREVLGDRIWHFNPWTGSRRPDWEVRYDPRGFNLEPPSHDPGTTSPPAPATTEAGTATQEPRAMDHEPASTSNPTPCAAPSAMNAVLSSLGAAVAEVNALTRTAVELSAKCRTLQEENGRLQERNDELVNRCRELNRLVDAASKIRTPAEETRAGPHMRAAAGEGGEA